MISPTPTTTTTPSPTPATPPIAATSSVISSDFETFLQMLTAQARYQDPLEPIDSTEYASQLAQFSMVEQQVMSNDLLTALAAQFGAGNMAQMSGWIGMEARTTAAVPFEQDPITVHPQAIPTADTATLVVYDDAGTPIQRHAIPNTGEPVQWAGIQDDGTPFPAGNYRFSVEGSTNGEVTSTTPAETYARITEARLQGTQTVLILEGGTAIGAGDVGGLREPSTLAS